MNRTGQRLYAAAEALAYADEEAGWPLAIYSNALGLMLEPMRALVSDGDDGVPGWANYLFSPDTEPAGWLPVTEAFVGVNPYPAVDEAGRRLRIKQTSGRYRGTRAAIKGAARQFLIGPDGTPESAAVFFTARFGGSATAFAVATLDSETPDPDLVEAAVAEQTPAGFQATYSSVAGGDYETLRTTHTDYADVTAQFATYTDVRNDPSIT
jgi:hypothetical protein